MGAENALFLARPVRHNKRRDNTVNNEQFQKLKQRTADAKREGLVMGMAVETMEELIALIDASLCTDCKGAGIVWQGAGPGACDWCGGMGKSGACAACELAQRATPAASPATAAGTITRWSTGWKSAMSQDREGGYVLYADHLQHTAAAVAEAYQQGRYDESMAQGPSCEECARDDAERDGGQAQAPVSGESNEAAYNESGYKHFMSLEQFKALRAAAAPVSAAPAFPPRDLTKPAVEQGIFEKFQVLRTDGSSAPGGKHHGCAYFVLDLTHDQHAAATMRAYGTACRATHPALADDIERRYGAAQPTPPDDERAMGG